MVPPILDRIDNPRLRSKNQAYIRVLRVTPVSVNGSLEKVSHFPPDFASRETAVCPTYMHCLDVPGLSQAGTYHFKLVPSPSWRGVKVGSWAYGPGPHCITQTQLMGEKFMSFHTEPDEGCHLIVTID